MNVERDRTRSRITDQGNDLVDSIDQRVQLHPIEPLIGHIDETYLRYSLEEIRDLVLPNIKVRTYKEIQKIT